MRRNKTEDIVKFFFVFIEPLEDNSFGLGYRASVYLTDGTFLPCVIFRNPKTVVNLAIRRFKEEQTKKGLFMNLEYSDICHVFEFFSLCFLTLFCLLKIHKILFIIVFVK